MRRYLIPEFPRPTRNCNLVTTICDLSSRMVDPKKYRDEAERLRREAIETPDRNERGTMIEVADLYDRLADTLERQQHQPKSH